MCGEAGYVTLEALQNELTTQAWAGLKDPDSTLSKVLLSDAFKSSDQGINFTTLMLFALIHCAGSPLDKTNVFFCVLQDGGFDKHPIISAGDKDFQPNFKKLCLLVTQDVFQFANDFGDFPTPYSDVEIR